MGSVFSLADARERRWLRRQRENVDSIEQARLERGERLRRLLDGDDSPPGGHAA